MSIGLIKKQIAWVLLGLVGVVIAGLLVQSFSFLSIPIFIMLIIGIGMSIFVIDKPYVALMLIAFLLPFERIGSFEFGGTTVRASQLVALLMLASWTALALYKRKSFNAQNPLLVSMFLFFAASIISFVNAINVERAIMVFAFEVFVLLVAIAIPNLITKKKQMYGVLYALFFSSIVVTLFGIYQFLGDMAGLPESITGLREQYTKAVFGFPRVQSTALEPLYFGNYLLIPLSVSLALFLGQKKSHTKFSKSGLIAVIFLSALNILLTVSRGAYVGMAAVIMMLGFIYIRVFLRPERFIPLVGLMGVAMFGLVFLIGMNDENVQTFVEHTTNISDGAGVVERLDTYDDALTLASQSPVFGVGVGNFGSRVAQSPYIMPEKGWLIVNNLYLEILAERGIVGLGIFMSLLIMVLLRTIKALRVGSDHVFKTILMGLVVAFVGVFVQYNTFSILYIFHVWFLIGLIIATQNILLSKPINETLEDTGH